MSVLKIHTDRLCWYTRGLLWDYTILCYPSAPLRKGWLTPIERVFGVDEPQVQPRYIAGTIHWEAEINLAQSEFIAATFLDEARTDRDGRNIKHYLLYLLDDETRDDFRFGWHSALLESLATSYEEIFPLSPEDLSKPAESTTLFDIRELIDRFHRKLPKEAEIKVSEDSEECPWFLQSIHMDTPPTHENSRKRRTVVVGGVITVGIGALLASLWHRWERNSQPPGVDAHTSIEVSADARKDSEAPLSHPQTPTAAHSDGLAQLPDTGAPVDMLNDPYKAPGITSATTGKMVKPKAADIKDNLSIDSSRQPSETLPPAGLAKEKRHDIQRSKDIVRSHDNTEVVPSSTPVSKIEGLH